MGGSVVIGIEGLNELRASLKRIEGAHPKEMRLALNDAAELIVKNARPLVPRRSGRAAASMKAASTQTQGRVKAGGGSAPYYPWLDFGGSVGRRNSVKRPYNSEGRYIYPTFKKHKREVQQKAEGRLIDLIERTGLRVT